MRTLLLLALLISNAYGMERLSGWCEQGAKVIVAPQAPGGTPVSRSFMQSYPRCTVTVYVTGTSTLATIYSTNNPSPTPLTNPFSATNLGYWDFYALNGHYDVQISGGGLPAPFTFGDMELFDIVDYNPCLGCYLSATGFISTAGLYNDFSSQTGGMYIRGIKVSQNATATAGGYLHFTPITYNPNGGPPVYDQYGNPVRDPVFLGGDSLGAHDAVLFLGEATDMIPNPDLVMGLFTNVYMFSRVGFATDFNSIASFQSLNGGMVAQSFAAVNYMNTGQHAGTPPPLTNLDQFHPGAIFYDTTAGCEKLYNGSTWSCIGSGGGGSGPAGSNTEVQFNNGGVFGASSFFTWNSGLRLLNVVALNSGSAGINVQTGFIQSAVGFVAVPASATTYNAVSALGGGMAAHSFTADRYMQAGNNNGVPTLSGGDSFNAGALYYDTGSNCLELFNGASWGCISSGGSTSPGGTNTAVQFNSLGTFGGSTNFTYNPALQLVNIVSAAGTAGLNVQGGFIQSAQGFVALPLSATTYNAVSALGGGMAANSFTAAKYIQAGNSATIPTVSGGDSFNAGALYYDTTIGALRLFNGSSWASVGGGGSAAGANTQVQFNNSGSFGASVNFTFNTGTQLLNVIGSSTANAAINAQNGFIQSEIGFVATGGTANTYNAVQAVTGGMTGKSFTATQYVQTGLNSGVPSLTTGDSFHAGAMYWDTSLGRMQVFNGTAWTALSGSSTPGGSGAGEVQFNSSGAFAGNSNLTWNQGSQFLNIVGSSNSLAALNVQTGFIQTAGGVVNTQTTYNAYQAVAGGVLARSLTSVFYTQVGNAPTIPGVTSGDSFHAGAVYWDTGLNRMQVFNGTSWTRLGPTNAAGSNTEIQYNLGGLFASSPQFTFNVGLSLLNVQGISLNNAVINAQTGFIQSDGGFVTSRTTFNAVQAPSGGFFGRNLTALTYTNPGTNSGVPAPTTGDGFNGGAMFWDTSSQEFKMYVTGLATFSPVINANGAFVGKGVDVGSFGVQAAGYNVTGGFIGQTWTVTFASFFSIPGVCATCTQLIFKGGVLVGAN